MLKLRDRKISITKCYEIVFLFFIVADTHRAVIPKKKLTKEIDKFMGSLSHTRISMRENVKHGIEVES